METQLEDPAADLSHWIKPWQGTTHMREENKDCAALKQISSVGKLAVESYQYLLENVQLWGVLQSC